MNGHLVHGRAHAMVRGRGLQKALALARYAVERAIVVGVLGQRPDAD